MVRGRYGEERDDEIEQGRWLVRERRTGTYARAITLPSQVDPDRIESSFENGELRIQLPKAAESRARRIPIQAGAGGAKQVGTGEGRATGGTSGGGSHEMSGSQTSGSQAGRQGPRGTAG
jgi:HSP20 family protein